MAATDQHYRNQNSLDIVFGVSCGALLLTTVWMLVADYAREFKGVQRKFRDVEATIAERDMVDRLPDSRRVTEGLLAVRVARAGVLVAKARTVDTQGLDAPADDLTKMNELVKKAPESREARKLDQELQAFPGTEYSRLAALRVEDLDEENRDKLERRLNRLENNSVLRRAEQEFAARERRIQGRREQADENYRGVKAEYDAQASYFNIAIDRSDTAGAGRIKARLGTLEDDLAKWKGELDKIDADHAELRRYVTLAEKTLTDREDDLKKTNSAFDRFAKVAASRAWGVGDTIRNLPILDGFAAPTKINQVWLADLTIDYGGFRDVPRYDRCTTCHLGIERGTFDKDMLRRLGNEDENRRLTTKVATARDQLEQRQSAGEKLGFSPSELPGERSGNIGLISLLLLASAVVAALSLGVLEKSLRVGINTLVVGLLITGGTAAGMAFFAPVVPKVKDINLSPSEVNMYCAHPRLDLFVDSNSAHPVERFGCTICHDGQGSATEFGYASHTPNDSKQEKKWKDQHGWKASHYWDFPMLPKRFVESSCLKCHHQVTDLISKGVKEEAPRLLKGYNIIREAGCFGCHEILGTKGGQPVGPDMRNEPGPALDLLTAADQERLRSDPANLPGTYRKVGPSLRRLAEKTNEEWTRKWVMSPRGFRPDTKMPHFYGLSTNSESVLPDDQKAFPRAEIASISYYLIQESKRGLNGGDFTREALLKGRNNINDLQARLGKDGLSDRDMKDLFDASKRFSDLALLSAGANAQTINAHALRQRQLQEQMGEVQRRANDLRNRGATDAELKPVLAELAAPAKELAGVTAALVLASTPPKLGMRLATDTGERADLPAKDGDAANGRRLFTEKGCLACHAHEGTNQKSVTVDGKRVSRVISDANFGPELSRIREKLTPAAEGATPRAWLVQWIMNPMIYHPRTRMPVTHLSVQDANDIATFLLTDKSISESGLQDPGTPVMKDLVALARVYLAKAPGVTRGDLDTFLPADGRNTGIPATRLDAMPRDADERALAEGGVNEDSLKWYIGRKAIGRLGCYGCHDIPGFETAKPIGTGLNDWGRKDPARIAFEDGQTYAKKAYHLTPTIPSSLKEVEARLAVLKKKGGEPFKEERLSEEERHEYHHLHGLHRLDELEKKGELSEEEQKEAAKIRAAVPFEEIFFEALSHHHATREGFLHLKLLEPRSYDYNRLRPWDDRLRMPQFKFARTRRKMDAKGQYTESEAAFKVRADREEAEAREAVMTFILGLVAEPVPAKYRSGQDREKQAEAIGRQVLDKYNCASCHQVRPGVYEFKATPQSLAALEASHTRMIEDKASLEGDHVYPNHNGWFGPMPTSDRLMAFGVLDEAETEKTGKPQVYLAEALRFNDTNRRARDIRAGRYLEMVPGEFEATAPYGGDFTTLMMPYLSQKDKELFKPDNPAVARSVLPPPLHREGERVQPDWLYRFLLNPGVVRPEGYMLLRMPKFNMSPDEAKALVNYFAATAKMTNPGAGVTYPYVELPQKDSHFWKQLSDRYVATAKARLASAKKELADPKTKDPKRIDELKKLIAGVNDGLSPPADAKGGARDPYSRSALQLLVNKDLCISCHSVGPVASQKPQGPNLALAADRLRPDWVEKWVANPDRMFLYKPLMPQNFPNVAAGVEYTKFHDLFVGTPLEQTRAARNLLMDGPRLSELLSTYKPPPPMPDGGKEK